MDRPRAHDSSWVAQTGIHVSVVASLLSKAVALLLFRAETCSWWSPAPAMFLKRTRHSFPDLCFSSTLMNSSPLGFCCLHPLAWLSILCCGLTLLGHSRPCGKSSGFHLSILWGKRMKGDPRLPASPFCLLMPFYPLKHPNDHIWVWAHLHCNLLTTIQMGMRGSPSPGWSTQCIQNIYNWSSLFVDLPIF